MSLQPTDGSRRDARPQPDRGLSVPSAVHAIAIGTEGPIFNLDTICPDTFIGPDESRSPEAPLRAATKGMAVIYAYLAGLGIRPAWESRGMYVHRPAELPFERQPDGESKLIHVIYERQEPDIGKLFFYGRSVRGNLSVLGVKASSGEFLPIALVIPNQDLPSLAHHVSFMKLYSDHPEYQKVQRAGYELGLHEFSGRDHEYDLYHLGEMLVGVEGFAPFKQLNSPGMYLPTSPVTTALMRLASMDATSGKTVLDVGTGSGVVANFLASNAGCEVDGIDANPRAVIAARSASLLGGTAHLTRFWESDVFAAVFGKYDLIVCYPVLDRSIPDIIPNITSDPNRFDLAGNFLGDFFGGLTQFLKPAPESRIFIGGAEEVAEKLPPELKIIARLPAGKREHAYVAAWRDI